MKRSAGVAIDAKLAMIREHARSSGASGLRHPQNFVHVIVSIRRRSSKHNKNIVNLRTKNMRISGSGSLPCAANLHGAKAIRRIFFPTDEYSADSPCSWACTAARGVDGSGAACTGQSTLAREASASGSSATPVAPAIAWPWSTHDKKAASCAVCVLIHSNAVDEISVEKEACLS